MTDQQIKANLDQHNKIEELYNLYKQGEKELGFFGKAGVGKTHSAKTLMHMIKENSKGSFKIVGAAISHSAKNVLKQSLGDVEVLTVASLLQLKKVIDPLTGDFKFLPDNTYKMVNGKLKKTPPPITYADLIIIDECSQINTETKKLIDEYRKSTSVIIYLGDWHQTPPVEEDKNIHDKDSSTFNVPNVHLNIPFRYEGELEELADAIALEIDKFNETGDCDFKFLLEFVNKESSSYKFYRNETEFLDKAIECFKSSSELKHCVLVCYRNETSFNDNLRLKEAILNTSELYTINEKVVAKSSYFENGEIIIQNNSLYVIKNKVPFKYAFVSTKDGKLKDYFTMQSQDTERSINSQFPNDVVVFIETYHLQLENMKGEIIESDVPVLKVLNDKKFAYFKTLLHSRCKKVKDGWKDYHEINDHFTPFASAYVVNTYVVQGDTYENVFVNFRDILTVKPISRKEKLQSLYTAVTRAKTHVSILV